MEFSTNDLVLSLARLHDHDGILEITKGEDLWGGLDYLPFALKPWLQEGEDEQSNRRNLVFTIHEKIVGFMSIYFQNGGKDCVKFAFRVSKIIRGKGFGKQITALVGNYLRENFPNLETSISAIPDVDLSDEEIISPKHGNLLSVKSVLVYRIRMKSINIHEIEEDECKTVTKEEFAEVLRTKERTENLLECNLVHMNWVPVILETEQDIEFATRKNQVVLLKGSLDFPTSFSVFTLPYSVPNGNTRASIDIFANAGDDVKQHIRHQMKLFDQREKLVSTKGETMLSIIVAQDMVEATVEAMELLGLQKFKFVNGSQKRDVSNMYLYQKQV